MIELVDGMSEDEYMELKERLISDLWAWVGKKLLIAIMFVLEWSLKAIGAGFPFVLAWLKKSGYIDE